MADTKKPSLTVLGGPMAGTRFVFEDASEDITVGSDEGCSFRLQLPGVGPNHARIVVEGGAMSIHDTDTGGERGLHVNDNRVGEGGTALRNGDIVWLGTPGDAEVVMLQCILPRLTPAPFPAAPMPAAPEDETATLALEPDTLFGVETVIQPPPSPAEPSVVLAEEFVMAQEPSAAPEPVTFAIDDEPTQMLPPSSPRFEDETEINETVMDAPFVVSEESSTVVLDAMDVTGEMPEPTVVLPAEPEVTLAMPPLEPTVSVPWSPPDKSSVKPVAAKPAAPKPSPPPVAKAASPSAAIKSPPARPAPSPRPRPQPADRSTPPPPRASGGSSTGRYAVIGIVALVVLSAGGYAAWRFLPLKPGPKVAQARPAPTTLSSASTPLVTQATPHPIATAEPRPVEPPTPAPVVATPTPKASATPAAAPSPSPSPSPKKASPTPAPVSTGPSAEAQRAQQAAAQVASLLGQAEAALGSRQYDQAIGHFDEVLRLDPQNAKALADKATAVSLREAARKKFVPGRTAVKTEKASGGLAGFDSGDVAVQKAPDFLGRIEFEMSPASGIKPGDAYTLRFFLVNDGKKAIRIQGITVSTVVNGTGSGAPVSAGTREVAPQQRAQLGEVSGSWKDGTTSWSAEVLVTANKGDSLKNQITWR